MNEKAAQEAQASPEQIAYANILFYGAWGAIFLMIITYLLYVFGFISPHVPIAEIPKYWSLPVHEFHKHTETPLGWGWLALLSKGDFLNFIGIALLGVLTIIAFLILIPAYVKKRDWPYLIITVLEILVLAMAASGTLGSGGH